MRRACSMKSVVTVAGFLSYYSTVVLAAGPPMGMLDFDRQVSFSKPMMATIFRAFNDDHLFYALPNRITVERRANSVSSSLTLLYGSSGRGQSGLLSVKGWVDFGGDYQDAVNEIRGDAQPSEVCLNLSCGLEIHVIYTERRLRRWFNH